MIEPEREPALFSIAKSRQRRPVLAVAIAVQDRPSIAFHRDTKAYNVVVVQHPTHNQTRIADQDRILSRANVHRRDIRMVAHRVVHEDEETVASLRVAVKQSGESRIDALGADMLAGVALTLPLPPGGNPVLLGPPPPGARAAFRALSQALAESLPMSRATICLMAALA